MVAEVEPADLVVLPLHGLMVEQVVQDLLVTLQEQIEHTVQVVAVLAIKLIQIQLAVQVEVTVLALVVTFLAIQIMQLTSPELVAAVLEVVTIMELAVTVAQA